MTSAETALGLENKRDSSDATDRSTVMVRLGTQVVWCAARMMMIEEEQTSSLLQLQLHWMKQERRKKLTPE